MFLRILISAYACEPDRGSEQEVGLRIVLAAARKHDVWLLTRANDVEVLLTTFRRAGVGQRVRVVGVEVPGLAKRLKHVGLPFLHWYYDRWQRAARDTGFALDREVDFDLVHHATWATYWTRTGVASLDKPLVWGPVGGGARTPTRLLPALGVVGIGGEAARVSTRRVGAGLNHAKTTAKNTAVVMVQNLDTFVALGSPPNAVTLPNALSVDIDGVIAATRRGRRKDIVFASRLIPWKAATVAVDAIARLRDQDASLHIYGEGPDRRRVQRRVAALGLEARVHIHGRVPRQQLLAAIASSEALVHPALHDEAPLAVAEALSLGTPVVALNHAGPAAIAGHWPKDMSRLVAPSTPAATVRELAQALDEILHDRLSTRFAPMPFDFDNALLSVYDSAVESPSSVGN